MQVGTPRVNCQHIRMNNESMTSEPRSNKVFKVGKVVLSSLWNMRLHLCLCWFAEQLCNARRLNELLSWLQEG